MTNNEIVNIVSESLRDWFKKEKWVRITTSGNIAGPCGTSKNKKNPDRCLPKAKAQSLSKGERAATAAKKKRAGKKGKTVVKNTKKATVKKEAMSHPVMVQQRIAHAKKAKQKERDKFAGSDPKAGSTIKGRGFDWKKETKEAPAGHYFTASGNLVKGRMSKDAKERGARKSDPKDKQRSKVPKVSQYAETANPQDGKAAPYGSGYKPIKMKKEDIKNLVVGLLYEAQGKEVLMEKDDRCTRLAKQRYDTWPSAYASGFVVRCRQGKIMKKK